MVQGTADERAAAGPQPRSGEAAQPHGTRRNTSSSSSSSSSRLPPATPASVSDEHPKRTLRRSWLGGDGGWRVRGSTVEGGRRVEARGWRCRAAQAELSVGQQLGCGIRAESWWCAASVL